MKRHLAATITGLLIVSAMSAPVAENTVVLNIVPTTEFPRNSEGSFVDS